MARACDFGVMTTRNAAFAVWVLSVSYTHLAMPFVLPQSILERLISIGNIGDSSTAYRVSVWIASARMARDFWMSGVGFGSDAFAAVYSGYALNGAGFALHSHNFYIQLVVDMGIGGLCLLYTSALLYLLISFHILRIKIHYNTP